MSFLTVSTNFRSKTLLLDPKSHLREYYQFLRKASMIPVVFSILTNKFWSKDKTFPLILSFREFWSNDRMVQLILPFPGILIKRQNGSTHIVFLENFIQKPKLKFDLYCLFKEFCCLRTARIVSCDIFSIAFDKLWSNGNKIQFMLTFKGILIIFTKNLLDLIYTLFSPVFLTHFGRRTIWLILFWNLMKWIEN